MTQQTRRLMTFPDAVAAVLDRPYRLGGTIRGEDCISLLFRIYPPCGASIPEEHNGWTITNYAVRYAAGEDGVGEALRGWLESLGQPVDPAYMIDGDLIILRQPETPTGRVPAIYTGSGHALIVSEEHGVVVVPYRAIEDRVESIRRILPILPPPEAGRA